MGKSLTQEEFEQKVRKARPYLTYIGKYRGEKGLVLVKDEYGAYHIISADSLLVPKSCCSMHTAVNKDNAFKKQAKARNTFYKNMEFEIIGEYNTMQGQILCKNKYGYVSTRPDSLIRKNVNPCIDGAVDKTRYWINMAKEVHGDKYDYSNVNYVKSNIKCDIRCKSHNYLFSQTPHAHLSGQGCPKCGNEKVGEAVSKKLKLTRAQFVKKVLNKNPQLEYIGKYRGWSAKVLVRDKYGYLMARASSLISYKITMKSALDRSLYIRNKINKENVNCINLDLRVIDVVGEGRETYAITENKYGLCKQEARSLWRHRNNMPDESVAIDKNKYFNNRIKELYPNLELVGDYIDQKTWVNVMSKYGINNIDPRRLLKSGLVLTIQSSIDKDSYFRNWLLDCNTAYKEGEFEVLGSYRGIYTPVVVENSYGKMSVSPKSLLNDQTPCIYSAVNPTAYRISQFKEAHGDKYDYSEVVYKDNYNKVKIRCATHGIFEQVAYNHLSGQGCPKCGAEKRGINFTDSCWRDMSLESGNFDSYKVYVLKCWDEETGEKFYKIGRTYTKIKGRFPGDVALPYSYEVLKIISEPEDYRYICNLERFLQKYHSEYRYEPSKKFGGHTECFYRIDEDYINKDFKDITNIHK